MGHDTHHYGAPRLRRKLGRIIFGVHTTAGWMFDLTLLGAIVLSVAVLLLESVPHIEAAYGTALRVAEWILTVLFTVEYGVRLWVANRRRAYATSFFGIVDLLAILPTYLSALFTGTQSLAVVRGLRLLRVFRVLKLVRHLREAHSLMRAVRASRPKIVVFLTVVFTAAIIFGTIMHMVEGEESGFTSIPTSIYWVIVTMTTVGYGDIAPRTPVGQFLALCLMIFGYALIAVPTGIMSVEFSRVGRQSRSRRTCPRCGRTVRNSAARFCSACGFRLPSVPRTD